MNKLLCYSTVAFIMLIFSSCKENEINEDLTYIEINAKAPDFNVGSGVLNVMGYFVEPQFYGTINNEGSIKLNFPDAFNEISLQAFNEYNSIAGSEYELSPIGIQDLLTSVEDLEINGDHELALAGKYYGYEVYVSDVKTGRVFPASSREFMLSIISPEKYEIKTGYYYMMVYSNGNMTVTGNNKSPIAVDDQGNYSQFSHTSYDLKFHKGWNAVKYEVISLIKNDNNISQIGKSAFKSVKPEELDFDWVYFPL